ncbi:winged helix-turn-helix domain-containing protein [Natronoglycomyces albus]|uniref:Helix-turn-helix transcriptional regulator n=1 Tax=Natronoglycomyces albus TaxID=2811108 RepID=A0A895XTR2_9ACTN|nr:helix-turn-helix domain-containing protein [Natronoglycomyces albus]QSB06705.1 helix-turn-helix transcriptional regulator [Natronoglycomyces albus]
MTADRESNSAEPHPGLESTPGDTAANEVDRPTVNDIPQITDFAALKAIIHPLRARLYEELFQRGPSTATELAGFVGDSQANCSWHLRQLHKHGFVEEAEPRKGRARPWKVVDKAFNIDLGRPETEEGKVPSAMDMAMEELGDAMLNQQIDGMHRWVARRRQVEPEWVKASRTSVSFNFLTVDELQALNDDISALIDKHIASRAERSDPSKRPPGARAIRLTAWAVPGAAPNTPDQQPDQTETDPPETEKEAP